MEMKATRTPAALAALAFLILSGCPTPTSQTRPPDPDKVTIMPEGGSFSLGNGLVLKVPTGAVASASELKLRPVPSAELGGST